MKKPLARGAFFMGIISDPENKHQYSEMYYS